jgi:outer membrane protein OmpA-like peptidoglycan-associated protein
MVCGKKKEKEEDATLAGKTYADYLAERGYKPLCCDNTGKDLWLIFCCFVALYCFLISFFCLNLKGYMATMDTSAYLWMAAYIFVFAVLIVVFAITASSIGKLPAPELEEEILEVELANLTFNVGGHTNKASSAEQAQVAMKLSQERAAAVVAVFTGAGCKQSGVVAQGYGDTVPNPRAKTEYDNMRVECSLNDVSGLKKSLEALKLATNGLVVLDDGSKYGDAGISLAIEGNSAKLLHDPIFFEANSAVLTPDGKELAQRIATQMNKLEAASS